MGIDPCRLTMELKGIALRCPVPVEVIRPPEAPPCIDENPEFAGDEALSCPGI